MKNHSESLLCTAGRLWSSREYRTSACERRKRSRRCLGHENCVLPDEVPECKAEHIWSFLSSSLLQVKIRVRWIIPVRCVSLIRPSAADTFNASMDIWNSERVRPTFFSIGLLKHVNRTIRLNVMATNQICHFLRSLRHCRRRRQHPLHLVNPFHCVVRLTFVRLVL